MRIILRLIFKTARLRLIFKTASYTLTHVCVAVAVSYAITRDLQMALGIGLIEPVIQAGVFAIHDYLWEHKKTK